MSAAAVPYSSPGDSVASRLLRAGVLTAVVDGLWAVVLTFAYGRPQMRLWQGIAATLFGERMYEGGIQTAALGVLMLVGVAFTWSAVLLALVMSWPWLRSVLLSPGGIFKVAAVYGPIVWIVMSCVVIPALVHKPVTLTYRWFIQAAGHIAFVGLPMAWAIARGMRRE